MAPTHRIVRSLLPVTNTKRSHTGTAVQSTTPAAVQISQGAESCCRTVTNGAKRVQNADGVDTVNLKKILTFAGIALLLFFLIAEPQQAAQLVQNILNSLRTAAEALITFVRQLF